MIRITRNDKYGEVNWISGFSSAARENTIIITCRKITRKLVKSTEIEV